MAVDELVQITLKVTPDVAARLNSDKGAELVFRTIKKKYERFVKCAIADAPAEKAEAIKKAASRVASGKNTTVQNVRKICSQIDKSASKLSVQMDGVLNTAKQMSANVDKIANGLKLTQTLSFLNVGLSVANMAVDVAGFVVVTQKLNELSADIKQMEKEIGKIGDMMEHEKISTCEKLIMRFNSVSDKLQNGDTVECDTLESLLIDIKAFLSEMMGNLYDKALGVDMVLNIVMTMLPAYTILLTEFIKQYYFEKQSVPGNYDLFISQYKEFQKLEFRRTLIDYFFLDLGLSWTEAFDDTNMVTLLALNDLTQIEDQMELLQMTETEEEYKAVDLELSMLAQNRFDDVMAVAS